MLINLSKCFLQVDEIEPTKIFIKQKNIKWKKYLQGLSQTFTDCDITQNFSEEMQKRNSIFMELMGRLTCLYRSFGSELISGIGEW